MNAANCLKNSIKASVFFLFVAAMTTVFIACDNEDAEEENIPNKEAPKEDPRNIANDNYDDLSTFLNTIAETDATGQVTNRFFGEALDAEDPMHLYIGVDKIEEAKDMFQLWMAPDVTVEEHDGGSLSAELTDIQGYKQGTVYFTPGTEENHVAEVTTNVPQQYFSRITFIENSAWPSGKLRSTQQRYCKFDIVENVHLKDLPDGTYKNDLSLNFVCIQGSGNGVKPVFVAITRNRYINPVHKAYVKKIRDSRYTPGSSSGSFPTAFNIQKMLYGEWNAFEYVFKEAGCGPLLGGTEYWYDESHTEWLLWEYNGVMDYSSGYTYGENSIDPEYYFLFRMFGLNDSQIYDGMSF